jgi:hypothetical protein
MSDDIYGSARSEKIKELRKLMHELMMSEDGDEPLSVDGLTEALAEAGDMAEEATVGEEMGEGEEVATAEESEDDDLSELERMKREYFKPKPKMNRREGTATMIAKVGEPKKPSFTATVKESFKPGKKGKYA